VSARRTVSGFRRIHGQNTHKFSANGAAFGIRFSTYLWPRRLHSFGKDGVVIVVFSFRPATSPSSLPQRHAWRSNNGPPMAGQSRPTIFFYVPARSAPIFFSRSSLGSSIVFSQNPWSCSFPFMLQFRLRVFRPVGFCLAAVDFGSTVLPV
jgi:hypothetical protein